MKIPSVTGGDLVTVLAAWLVAWTIAAKGGPAEYWLPVRWVEYLLWALGLTWANLIGGVVVVKLVRAVASWTGKNVFLFVILPSVGALLCIVPAAVELTAALIWNSSVSRMIAVARQDLFIQVLLPNYAIFGALIGAIVAVQVNLLEISGQS
jgi:hypothetical protein